MPIRIQKRLLLTLLLVGGICHQLTCPTAARGQDETVYRLRADGGTSKVSGKVTEITPFGVTVQSNSGPLEIPFAEIDKVVTVNEPLEVGRARDRLETGRFDDVLAELQKITDPNKAPAARNEIEFLTAAATAQISLRGGSVTAQDAGRAMVEYLKNNPTSYHFYPGTELLGKLLLAVGRPELAEPEFAKLIESKSKAMILRGYFSRGESLIEMGKFADAANSFQAIQAMEANDDLTQSYKLLAKVRQAKAQALQGQFAEAIQAIQDVIKVESPDNELLFAYAYNSLGTAQQQAGNLKEAATAFLHTELLYSSQSEPHAEALYQLALIWPQLEQTDRASRARNTLKTRYRNSFWATKL